MRKTLCILVLSVVCCLPCAALADEKKEAMTLVNEAIDMAKSQGLVIVFEQLNSPQGLFATPDGLYVFAYYLDGVMAAHYNQDLVGKDLLNKPDASGKLFRKEIVELAQKKGEGWVEYTYKEKGSGRLVPKITFCKKFDDFVFCCGVTK